MSDLSHTITMQPNIALRLFLWFWDAHGARLNTCLLFWGFLGIVLFWPIRLVLAGIMVVARAIGGAMDKRAASRPASRIEDPYAIPEPKPAREPGPLFRFLTRFADGLGALWFRFQKPITWAFRGLVGLVVLALAVLIVIAIASIPWTWAIVVEILITLGLVIVGIALVVGLLIAWDKRPRKNRGKWRRIYHAVHDHTCANVRIAND